MYWCSSSGSIELDITKAQARIGYHAGSCDDDVAALSRNPKIARQLRGIDATALRNELKEYGAWDDAELADHEQNLQRLLWLACGDIADRVPD